MVALQLLTSSFFLLGISATPIWNGNVVKVQSNFPYMVYLEVFEKTKVGYCGGVLVRRDAVLTAAHCLVSCQSNFDIRATVGILDTDDDEGQAIRSSGFKIHNDFGGVDPDDPKFAHNDIALVWLRRKFDLDENVKLAILPKLPVRMLNSFGIALGWGQTELNKMSTLLKRADLKVIAMQKCQEYFTYESFIGKSFCVKSNNELDGTCSGDSGGPFIFDGVVRGILSFSGSNVVVEKNGQTKVQCIPKFPQIFTDVSAYHDWINYQLEHRENDAKKMPKKIQGVCSNSLLVYRERVKPGQINNKVNNKPNRGGHKRQRS